MIDDSSGIFDLFTRREDERFRASGQHGVALGIVTSNKDEGNQGRVKIKMPWLNEDESDWIPVINFLGGKDHGSFFIPEVDDQVLVAFEQGDLNRPVVIGSFYSKEVKPEVNTSNGENNIKRIKTKSGHEIIFDDKENQQKLTVSSSSGHKISLDDSSGSPKISIEDKTGNNKIEFDSNQGSISISSQTSIKIKAPTIEIKADSIMTIDCTGMTTVKGKPIALN